jgi:hypothetical protein
MNLNLTAFVSTRHWRKQSEFQTTNELMFYFYFCCGQQVFFLGLTFRQCLLSHPRPNCFEFNFKKTNKMYFPFNKIIVKLKFR